MDKEETTTIVPAKSINKKHRLVIASTVLLALIAASTFVYLKIKYPTASPLTSMSYIVESIKTPHAAMKKQTIGFLPYWRLDDIKYLKFNLLSEVIFFSLTANGEGDIVKVTGNETEPGWRWWKSETVKNMIAETQISGGKISATIAMQKNAEIENFLTSDTAQSNLISTVIDIAKKNHLDGINIDFEYDGELSNDVYRDKFTQFCTTFTAETRDNLPNVELSIDLYPFSVEKPRLFDVAKLTSLFDRIIVMSYDYYGVASTVAGPVAPMGGFEEGKYYFDVKTTYSDFLKIVPKEKLVMGIPYYSWDYPVESEEPMSTVLPQNDQNGYTSIMSYGRMRTNTNITENNCTWDDIAKENWCLYKDALTEKYHQIWLEDNKSIGYKFDFAKTNDLSGIAIWTLGYDKNYPDLWDMVKDKFTVSK